MLLYTLYERGVCVNECVVGSVSVCKGHTLIVATNLVKCLCGALAFSSLLMSVSDAQTD